nr:PREDICTED: uncharacterized protein LOC106484152 isoform X2 [Apteryx mantelli mantelli]
MAFVPDLDTLESSSLNEETFYGLDCPCLQKKPRLSSDLQPSGQSPAEVGVQVTLAEGHPTKTFRQAAILVVAVTKLLKRPSHHDFSDSDLGSFLDAVFEPVAFQRFDSSYAGAPVYRYIRSQSFDIHDIDHKCFTLESPTQLVALHLQGPSANRKGEETPVPSRSLLCLPPRQQPAHPVSLLRSEAQHRSVPAQELEGQRRGHADTRGTGHQGVQALHVLRDERRQAHAAAGGGRHQQGHRQLRADPLHLLPPGQPGGAHHALRVGRLPRLVHLHLAAAQAARGHHQPARRGEHHHVLPEQPLSCSCTKTNQQSLVFRLYVPSTSRLPHAAGTCSLPCPTEDLFHVK